MSRRPWTVATAAAVVLACGSAAAALPGSSVVTTVIMPKSDTYTLTGTLSVQGYVTADNSYDTTAPCTDGVQSHQAIRAKFSLKGPTAFTVHRGIVGFPGASVVAYGSTTKIGTGQTIIDRNDFSYTRRCPKPGDPAPSPPPQKPVCTGKKYPVAIHMQVPKPRLGNDQVKGLKTDRLLLYVVPTRGAGLRDFAADTTCRQYFPDYGGATAAHLLVGVYTFGETLAIPLGPAWWQPINARGKLTLGAVSRTYRTDITVGGTCAVPTVRVRTNSVRQGLVLGTRAAHATTCKLSGTITLILHVTRLSETRT